ncbi:hypothetical protein HYH03_009912 [Edaphochlamys debaryana]|uniref:Inosine triphosphate pyrophosphatase n=1 Tax=Edaphochlamys debaryana TaxID=47281 RepID=A0A835Y0C6_9CHLO|nr:hypothetical protein HYH03_009912 [Edaphochlamys debaryana]|eukprot:KAG2491751.1 hypothetical protein HYH03_009912 [Edaphochlamys debaryana]
MCRARLQASTRRGSRAWRCEARQACRTRAAGALRPSKPERVYFATGNPNKLAEVAAILSEGPALPCELHAVELELPELQGEPEEICREKCRIAARQLRAPVLVEDTSLCCGALNGMPGPYIKWFIERLEPEGFLRMLEGFDDKSASFQCVFAFAPGPDAEPTTFVGRLQGRLVAPRGPRGSKWGDLCRIFELEGYGRTYAEMDEATLRAISHRSRALALVREHLLAL